MTIWIVEALRFFIVPCLEKENYFHSRVTYVEDKVVVVLIAGTRENFYDELLHQIRNIPIFRKVIPIRHRFFAFPAGDWFCKQAIGKSLRITYMAIA